MINLNEYISGHPNMSTKTCQQSTYQVTCGRDVVEGDMCPQHTFSLTKAEKKKGCIFGKPNDEGQFIQCCQSTYDGFDYCEDHLRYGFMPSGCMCKYMIYIPILRDSRRCILPATRDKYCKAHSIKLGLSE